MHSLHRKLYCRRNKGDQTTESPVVNKQRPVGYLDWATLAAWNRLSGKDWHNSSCDHGKYEIKTLDLKKNKIIFIFQLHETVFSAASISYMFSSQSLLFTSLYICILFHALLTKVFPLSQFYALCFRSNKRNCIKSILSQLHLSP